MDKKYEKLPLRNGVGIVLLNSKNKIFVAKRIDNPKNFWQMPQGGVDKNETLYTAALRELKEETSIVSVKLIKEIQDKFSYVLPDQTYLDFVILFRLQSKCLLPYFYLFFLYQKYCLLVLINSYF